MDVELLGGFCSWAHGLSFNEFNLSCENQILMDFPLNFLMLLAARLFVLLKKTLHGNVAGLWWNVICTICSSSVSTSWSFPFKKMSKTVETSELTLKWAERGLQQRRNILHTNVALQGTRLRALTRLSKELKEFKQDMRRDFDNGVKKTMKDDPYWV